MVDVAAIDCGSNSTRLLIANAANGKLEILHKEHQVTRLSDSINKTNTISDDSKKRFFKVLRKYLKQIEKYDVQEVFCIGTAVFRNSSNADSIIEDVKKRFNLEIKIITGEEEGLLTSLGVQSSFNNLENYLIVDIGGQSTELISDINNKLKIQSEDIGVVSMSENFFNENPINESNEKIADLTLKCLKDSVPKEVPGIAFLSGGQTEIEAAENLNLINKYNDTNFIMSYSYGRALQQSAIKFWSKDIKNIKGTQEIFNHRANMCSLAAQGKWSKELEEK